MLGCDTRPAMAVLNVRADRGPTDMPAVLVGSDSRRSAEPALTALGRSYADILNVPVGDAREASGGGDGGGARGRR